MRTVNIHQAKTHLSRLVEEASKGESFIIAKDGQPLVKVVPVDPPEAPQVRRLGFMIDQADVPGDLDAVPEEEIFELFGLAAEHS